MTVKAVSLIGFTLVRRKTRERQHKVSDNCILASSPFVKSFPHLSPPPQISPETTSGGERTSGRNSKQKD
jgi:hypothetical protein